MTNRMPSLANTALQPGSESSSDYAGHLMPEADAIRTAALAACGIGDDAESGVVAAALAVEVSASLEAARCDVLDAARQLLRAYRRQHDTRLVANEAETEWTVACFSSGSTREDVRRTNRIRRESLRAHEAAWHAYQAAAQQLCRATEWLVELEALEERTLA